MGNDLINSGLEPVTYMRIMHMPWENGQKRIKTHDFMTIQSVLLFFGPPCKMYLNADDKGKWYTAELKSIEEPM